MLEDSVLMSGGYGDIICASLEGEALIVAVKKLRPTGGKTERIRMAVVRSVLYPFSP